MRATGASKAGPLKVRREHHVIVRGARFGYSAATRLPRQRSSRPYRQGVLRARLRAALCAPPPLLTREHKAVAARLTDPDACQPGVRGHGPSFGCPLIGVDLRNFKSGGASQVDRICGLLRIVDCARARRCRTCVAHSLPVCGRHARQDQPRHPLNVPPLLSPRRVTLVERRPPDRSQQQSRLATTSTPAQCSRTASRAASRPGRFSGSAPPEMSMWSNQATAVTPAPSA